MQARWVWAVGAAFVAGVVAVGVVAAIDDGPQPADAQETTTTTATGGGGTATIRLEPAPHGDRDGGRHGIRHA